MIEFTWEASDGYGGGKRPQTLGIHDSDLFDCQTESEVESLIEDCVQNDFEQKVSPSYSDSEVQKVLEYWRDGKAEYDEQQEREANDWMEGQK